MCKAHNQSIFRECRDTIRRIVKVGHLSNREMQRILAEHDGCMNQPKGVDSREAHVVNIIS